MKWLKKISKLGSWSFDLTTNNITCSNEIYNIFEVDKDKFVLSYEVFLNAVHPDDLEIVNNAYIDSLKDKGSYEVKHRLLMDDGRIKWIKELHDTEFDKNGNLLISIGTVQDITKEYEQDEK